MKFFILFAFFLIFESFTSSGVEEKLENNMDTAFMDAVISLIQSTYPEDWLPQEVITDEYSTFEITHPSNTETYLLVDIELDRVSIAVLAEAQRDIPVDLAGYHFDFAPDQMAEIHAFFDNHYQTGIAQ